MSLGCDGWMVPFPCWLMIMGNYTVYYPKYWGLSKFMMGIPSNLQGGGDPWGSKLLVAETSPSVESLEL